MKCCLLCLEVSRGLLDAIEKDSKRWQELDITEVLEKHFWTIISMQQPCSRICFSCWQEVDNFHKFYVRIEEAHFGRIKIEEGNQLLDSKEEISQEISDISYCPKGKILIVQNELQKVIDIKQEQEVIDVQQEGFTMVTKDPLQKPVASKRKDLKRLRTKPIIKKSDQFSELPAIQTKPSDSDNKVFENVSDDDDNCCYEPDKNSIEYKNCKDGEEFIAENLKISQASTSNITNCDENLSVNEGNFSYEPDKRSIEYKNCKDGEEFIAENLKISQTNITKFEQISQLHEIKTETTDSDNNEFESLSEVEHDDCCYGPDKNPIKCKFGKDGDKIIAENFKSDQISELPEIKTETTDSDNEFVSGDEDDNCNNEFENVSEDEGDKRRYKPCKNPIKYKSRKHRDKFIAEHFKQMFCDICDESFINFSAIKKHFLMTHSIQKGYVVCCSKKFYFHNHLFDHLHSHLNPDHFKCTECGKILSDRLNLKRHMLRVHRPEEIVGKHSCEICGKSFTKAYVFRTHKLTHLPEEEKKFHCATCDKFYATSHLLKKHTELVHLKKRANVCYICGTTLGTRTEYKDHMNSHELTPTPVINCDICGLRLRNKQSLRLHKQYQHPVGGKEEHPCPLCGKVSPSNRALQKHITGMHKKGLDHKCTICGKAFRRALILKEHMASHTGTPLYTCPWCPKKFYSNGNLYVHRKNKHPKETLELKLQKYN